MTDWRNNPLRLTAPLPKVDRDELGHNVTLQILFDTPLFCCSVRLVVVFLDLLQTKDIV